MPDVGVTYLFDRTLADSVESLITRVDGSFYAGIQSAQFTRGATNLLINGGFETNITGWSSAVLNWRRNAIALSITFSTWAALGCYLTRNEIHQRARRWSQTQ